MMTEKEKAVIEDVKGFLDKMSAPQNTIEWWGIFYSELDKLKERNKHHPLVERLSSAVFDYIYYKNDYLKEKKHGD